MAAKATRKQKKDKKNKPIEKETPEEPQVEEPKVDEEPKMESEEPVSNDNEPQNGAENSDEDESDDDLNQDEEVTSFIEMGIDDRILLAVIEQGWAEPTPIQETAIPLILQGRDILAKARTGSGKTGAYAIPLLHKILSMKKQRAKQVTTALVLTPSRELCSQAFRNLQELMAYCQREITVVDISSSQMTLQSQKQILATKPDIIVSTPTKILAHLKESNTLDLKSTLELLVIDEADLLLSFGYEDEMKTLVNYLPKNIQTILLSATLNEEVQAVKSLYLHNPAILKLKDSAELPDPVQLEQYQITCNDEEDKFVLLYSILKLQLIKGKSLIFVNTVNRCYKLKLFLENFGIRSCVLNSELPINSRMHIIEQFNGGIYETIIASDEKLIEGSKDEKHKENLKLKSKKKKDKEYNISRGIDFRNVNNVINFDFPLSTKSYIHRVGRTARGKNQGTALSLVDQNEKELLQKVEQDLKESFNYKTKESNEAVVLFKPFKFKMDEIEGFRYRARDVMRSITTIAIKESRIKEIKNELLNSEKLKSYFDENPREAQILRHDKELNVTKLDEHLRNIPDYIIPPSLRGIQLKNFSAKKNKNKNRKRITNSQKKYRANKSDPLKSFNFAGLKKKNKPKN